MPPEETTSHRELPRASSGARPRVEVGESESPPAPAAVRQSPEAAETAGGVDPHSELAHSQTERPPPPAEAIASVEESLAALSKRVASRVAMDIPAPPPGASAASEDPLVGAVIADRYRLLARVGEGGMGAVYKGEHVSLRKRVAVKFLHAELSRVPDVVARFEREAIAAANLEHANVVAAHDFGRTQDGQFFLVMEFVEGGSLRDLLEAEKTLPPARALHVARHIAAALNRAHSLGIVHRDLKPENVVLVERDGDKDFAKVIDFGIAKVSAGRLADGGPALTQAGMVFGTPDYMAPEQALGSKVDHRADLYAFGIMVFEMLAGRRPFDAEDVMVLLGKHMTAPPPPVSETAPPGAVPSAVDPVIARMLAKSPGERFASAFDFIAALEQALGAGSGTLTPPFGLLAPPPSGVTGPVPAVVVPRVPTGVRARASTGAHAVAGAVGNAGHTARIAIEALNTTLKTNYAELRKDPLRHRRALYAAGALAAIALAVGIATRPALTSSGPHTPAVAAAPAFSRAGGPGRAGAHGASGRASAVASDPVAAPSVPAPAAAAAATAGGGEPGPALSTELAERLAAYRQRPDIAALLLQSEQRGQLRAAIAAFEGLAVRDPRDPFAAYVLGTLYMRERRGGDAAIERFSDALNLEPGFATDPVLVRYFVQRAVRGAHPPPRVEALLNGPLAASAAPLLLDVAASGNNAPARRHASNLLASPALARYLDATSRGLLELSQARKCEDKLPIVQRLGQEGDARAVPALLALHAGEPQCGGWFRRAVCNPCLADAVPAAVQAIQSRSR